MFGRIGKTLGGLFLHNTHHNLSPKEFLTIHEPDLLGKTGESAQLKACKNIGHSFKDIHEWVGEYPPDGGSEILTIINSSHDAPIRCRRNLFKLLVSILIRRAQEEGYTIATFKRIRDEMASTGICQNGDLLTTFKKIIARGDLGTLIGLFWTICPSELMGLFVTELKEEAVPWNWLDDVSSETQLDDVYHIIDLPKLTETLRVHSGDTLIELAKKIIVQETKYRKGSDGRQVCDLLGHETMFNTIYSDFKYMAVVSDLCGLADKDFIDQGFNFKRLEGTIYLRESKSMQKLYDMLSNEENNAGFRRQGLEVIANAIVSSLGNHSKWDEWKGKLDEEYAEYKNFCPLFVLINPNDAFGYSCDLVRLIFGGCRSDGKLLCHFVERGLSEFFETCHYQTIGYRISAPGFSKLMKDTQFLDIAASNSVPEQCKEKLPILLEGIMTNYFRRDFGEIDTNTIPHSILYRYMVGWEVYPLEENMGDIQPLCHYSNDSQILVTVFCNRWKLLSKNREYWSIDDAIVARIGDEYSKPKDVEDPESTCQFLQHVTNPRLEIGRDLHASLIPWFIRQMNISPCREALLEYTTWLVDQRLGMSIVARKKTPIIDEDLIEEFCGFLNNENILKFVPLLCPKTFDISIETLQEIVTNEISGLRFNNPKIIDFICSEWIPETKRDEVCRAECLAMILAQDGDVWYQSWRSCGEPVPILCRYAEWSLEDRFHSLYPKGKQHVVNEDEIRLASDRFDHILKVMQSITDDTCKDNMIGYLVKWLKEVLKPFDYGSQLVDKILSFNQFCQDHETAISNWISRKIELGRFHLICPVRSLSFKDVMRYAESTDLIPGEYQLSDRVRKSDIKIIYSKAFSDSIWYLTSARCIPSSIRFPGEGLLAIDEAMTIRWLNRIAEIVSSESSSDRRNKLFIEKRSDNNKRDPYLTLNPAKDPGFTDIGNQYFSFGRIIAIALIKRAQIGIQLPTYLFAYLINKKIEASDLLPEEPVLAGKLQELVARAKADPESETLVTFHEIPGESIKVSIHNVDQVVKRVIDAFIGELGFAQLEAMSDAFNYLIPSWRLQNRISADMLRKLVTGDDELDVDALEKLALKESKSYYHDVVSDKSWEWLFRWLKTQPKPVHRRFMWFVTGSLSLSPREITIMGPRKPTAKDVFTNPSVSLLSLPHFSTYEELESAFKNL